MSPKALEAGEIISHSENQCFCGPFLALLYRAVKNDRGEIKAKTCGKRPWVGLNPGQPLYAMQ